MSVASIRNLTVKYGNFTAVSEFSVDVDEGCTGLLGPNGAGKTTFLKTLLGFIQPASGSGHVLGYDFIAQGREIRQRIGLMPEQDCHIPGMTAVQFVGYAGELAGMPADQAVRRAHEVLEYCGLGEARYRNVETYSTGMKQRIKLAQALVHGPKLLLLDEPTNGLDPAGREEMLELVQSVSHGKGINVIICSHLLPDIERTADRVIVMTRGTLRAQGLIKDLKKIAGHPVDVELREDSDAWLDAVRGKGATFLERPARSTYRIQVDGLPEDAARLCMQCAQQTGAQIRGFHVAQRTLEDAFLEAVQSTGPAISTAPPPIVQTGDANGR
ncbi:MAG TPA: ABC transporter ATP-binding protein [Fimbriimonadaceae bacterium]|nr:ABC transporter ATP-binding protein [Fimbriimonadaceae bacterium]